MRVFRITESFAELATAPEALPERGFLWLTVERRELEQQLGEVQAALLRLGGGPLVDLHVSDLLNRQLPSQFDYTSQYDLMVFRRLAAGSRDATPGAEHDELVPAVETDHGAHPPLLNPVVTTAVGFAVYDRVLLTVHPSDCAVRDYFIGRLSLINEATGAEARSANARLPPNPDDLMLRMLNHMVDAYLELRRRLTRELGTLQRELLRPRARAIDWHAMLDARNTLHLLEDIGDDQHSAVLEWLDAFADWPSAANAQETRERELLRVRSRDVAEHIERVVDHVHRLQSSVDSAVQMHFSAVGQRTNAIMRTLTVLTAIFLPLNLITGFFGMNFDFLPLIHAPRGVWITLGLMALLAIGLGLFFWRKRYLGTR